MSTLRLPTDTIFARDFKIVRPIAEGGMGMVYLVEQISTGKERALKIVLPQMLHDPTIRARFTQEARIGAKIESDHVVEVVAAGLDEPTGLPWMAMELLKGRDLATALAERGAFSLSETRDVMRQLGHALASAHKQGIVHRDLKPENIFLADSRREGSAFVVKILDFGIAKMVQDSRAPGLTIGGLGTPLWLAPEQTHGGEISPATDVWALGLIAFALLTGKSFWKSATGDVPLNVILTEMFAEPLVPATARARDLGVSNPLPANFDGWFAGCVARDAKERFVSAEPCIKAFLSLADPSSVPAAAPAVVAGTRPWEPQPAPTMIAAPPSQLAPAPMAMLGVTRDSPPERRAKSKPSKMWAIGAIGALVLLPAAVFGAMAIRSAVRHDDAQTGNTRDPGGLNPEARNEPTTAPTAAPRAPTPVAPTPVAPPVVPPVVPPVIAPVAVNTTPDAGTARTVAPTPRSPVVRRPTPPPAPPPPPPPPPTCESAQHLSGDHCCNAGEEWADDRGQCICLDRRICGRRWRNPGNPVTPGDPANPPSPTTGPIVNPWYHGPRRRFDPGAQPDPNTPATPTPQPDPTPAPTPTPPPAPTPAAAPSCGACHQGSTETCNGCDDNCNGVVDEGC